MFAYVFILTLWGIDGSVTVDVVAYGLSGTDCLELMEVYAMANPHSEYVPSCELDRGEPWDTLGSDGIFTE